MTMDEVLPSWGFEVVHCLSISGSGSLMLHRLSDREPAKQIIRVTRMGELGLETALLYKVQGGSITNKIDGIMG